LELTEPFCAYRVRRALVAGIEGDAPRFRRPLRAEERYSVEQ